MATADDDDPGAALRRRAFLARTAFVSGAMVTGAGCGASRPRVPLAADEARVLLERLERGLARVREVPSGALTEHLRWLTGAPLSERVLRQTLESLVVADVTQGLPGGERVTGPFGARLAEELPVLARAVRTHHALLAHMPARTRRHVDARVREEPDLTANVASWLDGHAAAFGASTEGRLKIRLAARAVGTRLARGSASAVISDCVAKVERAAARSEVLTLASRPASRRTVKGVFDDGEGAGAALTAPTAPAEADLPPPPTPGAGDRQAEDQAWAEFIAPADERLWSARWARPGDRSIEHAGILMPLGLVTCGVTLVIGLVLLIIGGARNATWDGSPRFE